MDSLIFNLDKIRIKSGFRESFGNYMSSHAEVSSEFGARFFQCLEIRSTYEIEKLLMRAKVKDKMLMNVIQI